MLMVLALACVSLTGDDPVAKPPARVAPLDVVSALESVVQDAIARAEPSVVAIHRRKGENPGETLAVRGLARPQPGLKLRGTPPQFLPSVDLTETISFDFGSGVVVGDQGQILTAYHVVKGAARLEVRANDHQVFSAEIIAADPRSDMAVIVPVVEPNTPPPNLRPIALGDATALRKGSFLIALGNPFNAAQDGKPSASWGILSNTARRVEPDLDGPATVPRHLSFNNYPTLLQLDAKLNLGMSGGAVINMRGELVGLTTSAASPAGFDAMAGYAIPLDRIGRRAVQALQQGREIEYGLLGIFNPHNRNTNRVEGISPNSPADQGQLLVNDEVIGVDDQPVVDWDSLILAINAHEPGDTIRLKIRRGDDQLEKKVVLAKFPVDPQTIATNRPAPWRGVRVDYLSTATITRGGFPVANQPGGVIVNDVVDGSPASRAGLKKLQVILKVGGSPVSTPAEFYRITAQQQGPVVIDTELGRITIPE